MARNEHQAGRARDKLHIALLLAISLGIGIYIIATTVLIARDGGYYIHTAQNLSQNPIGTIKGGVPAGYPFFILISHAVVTFFSQDGSISGWIYSAQGINLLCRVLSLVPLYFIGKFLVGARRSFWGLLILILLPYPAEFGSDVIRDWPHILFLSVGLLFLTWGSRAGKWWMFAMAGLAAGLGQTIRPECAQIIIYGILWLLISLFRPRSNISRLRSVCLTLVLLIGFTIPAVPYMKVRGRVLPLKLKEAISYDSLWQPSQEQSNFNSPVAAYTALGGMPSNILKALSALGLRTSENLLYYFSAPLIVGFYYHYRKLRKIIFTERFFIFALIVLYLAMMVLLHIDYGYITRRHCMPIVVFTAFYIPVGLQMLARWLSKMTPKDNLAIQENRRRWFFVLMVVGLSVCAAKFARITPLRQDKQGYHDAANWLKANTSEEDLIATDDQRIGLYAQRLSTVMNGTEIPRSASYVVNFLDGRRAKPRPSFSREVREMYSGWMNPKKRKKRIVIYEVL